MILGLDISTACTGYAILHSDGKICKLGYIDLKNKKKFPDLFAKAKHVRSIIRTLHLHYEIDYIYIEPALVLFQKGKSSATTISALLKFNGIVSNIVFEETSKIPTYIPVATARKICGVRIPRGEKAKKCVMEHLLQTEPDFANVVEYTKKGNIAQQYYDVADSTIISKSGYLLYHAK